MLKPRKYRFTHEGAESFAQTANLALSTPSVPLTAHSKSESYRVQRLPSRAAPPVLTAFLYSLLFRFIKMSLISSTCSPKKITPIFFMIFTIPSVLRPSREVPGKEQVRRE